MLKRLPQVARSTGRQSARGRATNKTRSVTFGQNLRRLRERIGLTQLQLARAIGQKQQTQISKWERTDSIPTPKLIMRLAVALGCRPSDLLEGVVTAYDRLRGTINLKANGEVLTDDDRAWLALGRQLPPRIRRHQLAGLRAIVAALRRRD